MKLQDKIAKAHAEHEAAEPTPFEVELGGEMATIALKPLWGADWANLVATHPPRPGAESDEGVGYDTDGVIADYPASAITVDGESVDEETWRELVAVLTSVNRRSVASVIYGVNHIEPMKRLLAVQNGKSE